MRRDRLQLIGPEDTVSPAAENPVEPFAVVTTHDASVRALRAVDADEGPLPDDAA